MSSSGCGECSGVESKWEQKDVSFICALDTLPLSNAFCYRQAFTGYLAVTRQ